jgi:uncharacterized membrane protein
LFRLKSGPSAEQAWAAFRQFGGTLAGLSGLIGGIWLDWLRSGNRNNVVLPGIIVVVNIYTLIFIVSMLGRMLAAAIVLMVEDPIPSPPERSSPIYLD